MFRSYVAAACLRAQKGPIADTKNWARGFLRRNKFVSRAVTHSAAALNPKHESLIAAFKKMSAELIKVCTVWWGSIPDYFVLIIALHAEI